MPAGWRASIQIRCRAMIGPVAMKDIPIYFKGLALDGVRSYLSENNLELRFSPLQKGYYRLARPVIPLFLRQWLQSRYARRRECRDRFIWPDLVDLVRSNEEMWEKFAASQYPGVYKTAIVLTHDVETQRGFDFIPKVIELERAYGFRGSWNLVPHKYELRREITDFITATGNEIGIHGFNHDGTLYFSKKRFSERSVFINKALEHYGAVGFRSPQVHRNLKWLQALSILYDASCFDYDPYQPVPGGTGSIWPFMAGKFVELPYTIPQDHVLFYMLRKKSIAIWRNKAKWVADNHGMILTLTHPDYLRDKDHLKLYEEFLAYLNELPVAWRCLPREIAEWYQERPVN